MKYVTIKLQGGLGNQLFQIFTVIAYSMRYKIPFIFEYADITTIKKQTKRITYWNTMLQDIKIFTIQKELNECIQYNEKNFLYENIPNITNENSNIELRGYFQSYKYIEDYYEQIIELINLRELQTTIKQKYINYFENDKIIISMHFRMGDYKNKQEYHPIIKIEYYVNALKKMIQELKNLEQINILYFCEKEDSKIVDNNIEQIKKIVENRISYTKINDDIPDWEQLILMSCCDNNIIANSTFSWWGAYFNNNKNKIVCYSNEWFGSALKNLDTKDLFPQNWIRI